MQLQRAATFLFISSILWIMANVLTRIYAFIYHMNRLDFSLLNYLFISLSTGILFLLMANSYRSRKHNIGAREPIGIAFAFFGGLWLLSSSYYLAKSIQINDFQWYSFIWYPVSFGMPVLLLILGIRLSKGIRKKDRALMGLMMIGTILWSALLLIEFAVTSYYYYRDGFLQFIYVGIVMVFKSIFTLSIFFWAMALRKRLGENSEIISESAILDEL